MPSASLIYLDYNATAPAREEVVEEVARVMRLAPGNPGSRHAAGRQARKVLESARERIAARLDARPTELIFTSGGTESINLALRGLAAGSPGYLLMTPGEHPATEETVRDLERHAWRRRTLPIDRDGRLRSDALASIPWPEVRLATALLAHNETGVIQEVTRLAEACRRQQAPLHLDAVQAVGKIDVSFRRLNAAALSFAAHKFGGPRGIGGLLWESGAPLTPLLRGGHQEQDRRPGTECVALAAGMALALDLWHAEREQLTARVQTLRDRLWIGLQRECPPAVLIGHPEHRLPNTLNVAFPGCDGEALLVALDLESVCCSLGTTCASGSSEPSPVLAAMSVPVELHRSCLRMSIGYGTREEEIDLAINRIAGVVRRLRVSAR